MSRSTPQPEDFGAQPPGKQRRLARPKPPRVLISGDDLEDPADWDVVVVENDTIDDKRALEIARQRHRQLRNLPSLDERDIAQALGGTGDVPGEGLDGIDADAFVLPGDTPAPKRAVEPPPLAPLAFEGVAEPGDDLGLDAVVEEVDEPEALEPEPELAPEPEAPVAEDAAPAVPAWAPPVAPAPVDDAADEFYGIDGADDVDGTAAAPAPTAEGPAPMADDEDDVPLAPEGLVRGDDEGPLDDAEDGFYAIDGGQPAAPPADGATPEPVKLWGSGRARATDGHLYQPGEVPPDAVEEDEGEDDFHSSFPIDPDEFLTEEGAEVAVDELDYASVFGPVDAPPAAEPVPVAAKALDPDVDPAEIAAAAPITESPARRRRRRAAATGATVAGVAGPAAAAAGDGDLGPIGAGDDAWHWRDDVDEVYDPTQPLLVDHRPRHIREAPAPRRGKALVALGAAALVVLAVGVGSKVFNSAERPQLEENADTDAGPSSTTPPRATVADASSTTTAVGIDPGIGPTVPGETTQSTTRPRTSTTVKRPTSTTKPAGNTTTTTVGTTTTTEAPTTTEATTTTVAETTTTAP